MVGNKHAFFSAMFLDSFKSVIAYTYNGSFYYWKSKDGEKTYSSQPIVHGHFGPVSDLDWDLSKNFLVTTSEDQTSRIFANWKKNNSWHEVNRPQIHGYDINTIACISDDPTKTYLCKLVSGADEKIIRLFTPPFNLVKFLQQLSDVQINFSKNHDNQYYEKFYSNVEGSKQALGLMTKQVRVEAGEEEENFDYSNFNPDEMLTNKTINTFTSKHDYSNPPDEDFLTNNTLWPETNKLYGHGYEIISIAASHNGKYIASGGKAQSEKHSKLFLWNAEKNNLICKLDGHVLTIVQIEFSKNDEYILSVSRDRSLCVFKSTGDEKAPYRLLQIENETHARIIWSCSWSNDSELFVTGSRDKTVKVWMKSESQYKEIIHKGFNDSVTCVNLVPLEQALNNRYICIVGFENGSIQFFSIDTINKTFDHLYTLHNFLSHGATVKRIKSIIIQNSLLRIASCSDDFSTRIFEVQLEDLKKLL